MIFTEPVVTNCFSKIVLVIVQENKTKLLNLQLGHSMPNHLKSRTPHVLWSWIGFILSPNVQNSLKLPILKFEPIWSSSF